MLVGCVIYCFIEVNIQNFIVHYCQQPRTDDRNRLATILRHVTPAADLPPCSEYDYEYEWGTRREVPWNVSPIPTNYILYNYLNSHLTCLLFSHCTGATTIPRRGMLLGFCTVCGLGEASRKRPAAILNFTAQALHFVLCRFFFFGSVLIARSSTSYTTWPPFQGQRLWTVWTVSLPLGCGAQQKANQFLCVWRIYFLLPGAQVLMGLVTETCS